VDDLAPFVVPFLMINAGGAARADGEFPGCCRSSLGGVMPQPYVLPDAAAARDLAVEENQVSGLYRMFVAQIGLPLRLL
jgi:hypothetical protein